jgi:hypothetical protein
MFGSRFSTSTPHAHHAEPNKGISKRGSAQRLEIRGSRCYIWSKVVLDKNRTLSHTPTQITHEPPPFALR